MIFPERFGILVIACTLISVSLAAQPDVLLRTQVTEMFDDTGRIQWVQEYTGKVAGIHDIVCVIGFDGEHYMGSLLLPESGDQFDLTGEPTGGQVRLEEIDQSGLLTGVITGIVTDDLFTGAWWSRSYERQYQINCTAINIVRLRKMSPEFENLSGAIDGEMAMISVFKEAPGIVSAYVMRQNGINRWNGNCTNADCSMYTLSGMLDTTPVTVDFAEGGQGRYSVSINGESQSNRAQDFTVDYTFPLQSIARADYQTLVNAFYPVTGIAGFDNWVKMVFTEWSENVFSDSKATQRPGNRWKMQASGWIDMTMVSDNIFSGLITLWNEGKKRYDRKAFIYDVQADEHLAVEDMTRRNSSLAPEIDRHIQVFLRARYSRNDEFDRWLGKQDFAHVTVSPFGIVAFTDFDPVFGEESVMVPYTAVDRVLRNAIKGKLTE